MNDPTTIEGLRDLVATQRARIDVLEQICALADIDTSAPGEPVVAGGGTIWTHWPLHAGGDLDVGVTEQHAIEFVAGVRDASFVLTVEQARQLAVSLMLLARLAGDRQKREAP